MKENNFIDNFVKYKSNEVSKCSFYLLLAMLVSLYFEPNNLLIIFILFLIDLFVVLRFYVIKYRVDNNFYGGNRFEAIELLDFITRSKFNDEELKQFVKYLEMVKL